jgi:hypothetical protein
MTRNTALTALTALGSSCEPFHDPHNGRYAALPCAGRAPPSGAADNGGAPSSLRTQHRSRLPRYGLPGLRPRLPHMPNRRRCAPTYLSAVLHIANDDGDSPFSLVVLSWGAPNADYAPLGCQVQIARVAPISPVLAAPLEATQVVGGRDRVCQCCRSAFGTSRRRGSGGRCCPSRGLAGPRRSAPLCGAWRPHLARSRRPYGRRHPRAPPTPRRSAPRTLNTRRNARVRPGSRQVVRVFDP